MKVALQLYSVREDTAADFSGTLVQIAALGYEGVEFAGYGGLSADAMVRLLTRLGLEACGSHVGLEALENDFDAQVAYAKAIGCRYLVCPWAPVATKEDVLALAVRLSAVGKKVRAQGLVLGYHNHAHELFAVGADGTTGLDLLYDSVSADDLKIEADTHWLQRGKQNPKAFLRRYAGRVPLIHLKDMAASGESDAPVGEGVMDIRGIWDAAVGAGAEWAIVEMDTPSLVGIALGFTNLRKMGLAR